ncbi:hypothetical protein MHYP_G00354920 [Metynnis hypsauchen]
MLSYDNCVSLSGSVGIFEVPFRDSATPLLVYRHTEEHADERVQDMHATDCGREENSRKRGKTQESKEVEKGVEGLRGRWKIGEGERSSGWKDERGSQTGKVEQKRRRGIYLSNALPETF